MTLKKNPNSRDAPGKIIAGQHRADAQTPLDALRKCPVVKD